MRHLTMGSRRLLERVDATDPTYMRSITRVGSLQARTTVRYHDVSWTFARIRIAQRDWLYNFNQVSKKGNLPKKGG